ncbi:MAG: hypothetical protein MUE72_12915 [Chitinophagaceae bacterium]|nr:hypothetical protein [Chitinophagaceae bacterium]
MNKVLLTVFCLLLSIDKIRGQIPAQLFFGHSAAEYNFFWYKDLDKNKKVSLFNFTYFVSNYNSNEKNAYEIYQVATYNFTKNWGIASGGRFFNNQFSPQVAISYQYETEEFYLNIFPTVQYLPSQKEAGYSVFGLIFYRPKINNTWKLFNQLTFEPLLNRSGHVYSYQQLRIGVEYKTLLQFGIGVNSEHFGKEFSTNQNVGLFIRKEF